jgi:imidazolonepropionase-like amidohydrolase
MATVLDRVRVWDGERLLGDGNLHFEGAFITAIDQVPGTADQVIDCSGATALPGLMDAHVHMELDPEVREPPAHSENAVAAAIAARAARMVGAGITTARDLGGGSWAELTLRDRIAAGESPGPRLLCSGQPVTSVRGHCHFWGGEAADLAAGIEVIDRQHAHGVDLIKIMATGGNLTKGSTPKDSQFDAETLRGFVQHANALGYATAAHCHGTDGIHNAACAGITTIEHCSWVGEEGWGLDFRPEVVDEIAAGGCFVSPTVNKGWQRMIRPDSAMLGRKRKEFAALRAAGIPVIASTDSGIPGVFHHELPEALAVFAEIAEMTPEETLRTATSTCARALGLKGLTGQLRPGLSADILLVDGDPLADLAALGRPVGVWARGREILAPA